MNSDEGQKYYAETMPAKGPKNKILCIYHGNCADGFGAAWVVRKKFGDKIEFFPGVYQTEPPDVSGRHVLMVDFSYKRDVLLRMAEKAKTILILDHHKTAAADLAEFKPPCAYEDWHDTSLNLVSEGQPPIAALFDMERSGAGITWDYFFGSERPALINHIEDRDLWRFKLPFTRQIQATILSYPYDFDVWDKLMDGSPQNLIGEGMAIERKHFKDIAELVTVTERLMDIGGVLVPVANLPYTLTSDAGHLMATKHKSKIGVCYWDTETTRVFSLRSTDDGPDVSMIAKKYGGGGHAHAAGFSVPREHALARI